MAHWKGIITIGALAAALMCGCAPAEEAAPTAAVTPEPTVEETSAVTPEPVDETPPPADEDWVPTQQSVWTLGYDPLETSTAPACAEPIFYDFYGMVAITPAEGGLTWQTQTTTYSLATVGPNSYSGEGETVVEGHTLTIDVTFTSATTLLVTFTLTEDANPDCQHVYEYDGEFSW